MNREKIISFNLFDHRVEVIIMDTHLICITNSIRHIFFFFYKKKWSKQYVFLSLTMSNTDKKTLEQVLNQPFTASCYSQWRYQSYLMTSFGIAVWGWTGDLKVDIVFNVKNDKDCRNMLAIIFIHCLYQHSNSSNTYLAPTTLNDFFNFF